MNDLTVTMTERDFEQVVLCRDPNTGLESVIAIHDTTLGPSLGGIRMRTYPTFNAALEDALDLAQSMTYKAALAGLDLGGGKSVINADPRAGNRRELLIAHARFIESLSGRYIPAVDMGTTVDDLELVGQTVSRVSSQRRDPSYFTARGVVASMKAAVALDDWSGLPGVRVSVQGLGHVGEHVARLLVEAGAHVIVADIDKARAADLSRHLDIDVVPADHVLLADVDIVCPSAGGGVIDPVVVDGLKCRYVIGAANNVLSHASVALQLAGRGIAHVPDFIANAGGLIACEAEVRADDTALLDHVDAIGDTAIEVLRRAKDSKVDVVTVAVTLANERLASRRAQRPAFAVS